MGRDRLAAVTERLIAQGRSAQTFAMAVENAGRPDARALSGTLADLGAILATAQMSGPVVLIVGDVTAQARHAVSPSEPDKQARSHMFRA